MSDGERLEAGRAKIGEAAVQLFLAQGIHTTSMAQIVRASGMSTGSVYAHFVGKDELIAYVSRNAFREQFARIEEAVSQHPQASPAELLAIVSNVFGEGGARARVVVQVWGEAVANPAVRAAVNDVYARAVFALEEYCARFQSPGSTGGAADRAADRKAAAAQARVLVGLIYAQILQLALLDVFDPGCFADEARRGLPG